jgi:undecaprenyl-diphosphatase
MNKFLKNYGKYIIVGIGIVIFGIIATLLLIDKITPFDNIIYNAIISLKSDSVTNFFKLITKLCNEKFIIIATVLIFIILLFKKKKIGFILTLNVILCSGLNTLIKHIFLRPRPVGLKLIKQGGYSFPSGHSMMAVAFFGILIYLVCKSKWKKWIKILLSSLLTVLILLIGISRIYLGVHFASDVLAGFAIALSYLIIFTSVVFKNKKKKSQE